MPKDHTIPIQPLDPKAFAPFGRAILRKDGALPDSCGKGWQCWYPLGELQNIPKARIGLVRARVRPLVVTALERHLAREEWVFALDSPLVQTVALSAAADPNRPDPQTAAAFLIRPGQGVIMVPGIWHGVGMSPGPQVITYGFVLAKSPPQSPEDSGWVDFADHTEVRLALPRSDRD